MEVKRFTGEEMDALRSNPYTYKVTQCQLSFTTEFKELFWKYYNEGMAPKDILSSLGYAPIRTNFSANSLNSWYNQKG